MYDLKRLGSFGWSNSTVRVRPMKEYFTWHKIRYNYDSYEQGLVIYLICKKKIYC